MKLTGEERFWEQALGSLQDSVRPGEPTAKLQSGALLIDIPMCLAHRLLGLEDSEHKKDQLGGHHQVTKLVVKEGPPPLDAKLCDSNSPLRTATEQAVGSLGQLLAPQAIVPPVPPVAIFRLPEELLRQGTAYRLTVECIDCSSILERFEGGE